MAANVDSFLHRAEIQELDPDKAIAFLEEIRERRIKAKAKADRSTIAIQRTGKKDACISVEEFNTKLNKAEASLLNAIKKYEEIVRKIQALALEVT